MFLFSSFTIAQCGIIGKSSRLTIISVFTTLHNFNNKIAASITNESTDKSCSGLRSILNSFSKKAPALQIDKRFLLTHTHHSWPR